MFKNFTKRNILIGLSIVVLFGLIGFAEKTTSDKVVKNIVVDIKEEYGSHFIDENDVVRMISLNFTDSIKGKYYEEINLKEIEQRIKNNKFVEDVQVYKDFKGNLLIDVDQRRPIARVIQSDGPHAYIEEYGEVLPISEKFTARVMIIDGQGAGKLLDSAFRASEEAKLFLKMLQTIDNDPFLKSQVAQITRKKNGELVIFPQVGGEHIEFGKPDNIEEKFKKLKIYYRKIVQLKGFNKYRSVNLKFQDQIICE